MAAVSDEHGKRFQQDISQTEKWYSGKCVQIIFLIANGYIRETETGEYKGKKEVKLLINDEYFVFVTPCIETFIMKRH